MTNILTTIFTDIESFLTGAETDVTSAWKTLEGGVAVVNNAAGAVLGQVQTVLKSAEAFDPALISMIEAGVSAFQELQADVASALQAAGDDTVAAVTASVSNMNAQLTSLSAQVAPLYTVAANAASAVSADAVAAVKTLTAQVAAV